MSYLLGGAWLVLFTAFFYGFGAAIRRQAAPFVQNLVVGYIAYSFMLAVLIVPMQFLGTSFVPVVMAVVAVFSLAVVFTLARWRSLDRRPQATAFLRDNYFLVIVVVALMGIYALQTDLIWNNNNTDDGFYLVKSATLPYLADPFNTVYGTGFADTSTEFNSYLLSTIQAEMAVYIKLLGIDPVFFMRGVLNVFNYLLVAASISWFAKAIFDSTDVKVRSSWPQYSASILLLLAFEFRTMETWNIVAAQDLWHVNSAMWYGGTIVRVVGILWLVTPFLQSRRIGIREIGMAGVVSVVLVSKAAAAIPLIIVAGVGYLLAFALTAHRYVWRGVLGLLALLLVAGVVLPGHSEIAFLIGRVMLANVASPALWASLALVALAAIAFRTRSILRMVIVLATVLAMMITPEVNDVFESASTLDFVAMRTQTSAFYTLIIFGFVSLVLLVAAFAPRPLVPLQFTIAVALGVGAVASTIPVYGSPMRTWNLMKEYPLLMPTDTADLSKKLEMMADGQPLDAIVPEYIMLHERRHYVASVLRTYAPHVRSISALTRFGPTDAAGYPQWGLGQQSAYDKFVTDPSPASHEAFAEILAAYPIDIVVFPHDGFEQFARRDGFELVERVGVYRVYERVRALPAAIG
ncbi:DUF6077 domain-containing protein [Trueperella pecoris]|nr:DUF6077 domain-containing protein [Trueperella pecoris]